MKYSYTNHILLDDKFLLPADERVFFDRPVISTCNSSGSVEVSWKGEVAEREGEGESERERERERR